MKLAKIVGLVLLIINAAKSVPVKEVQEQEEEIMGEEMLFSNVMDDYVMEDNTTVDVDGEGTNPSAHFKEEVKEYFQQEKFRKLKLHNRVARQNNERALQQGDTIALQSSVRWYWASCSASSCSRHTCPLMQMTGNDWTNCWGEVFQIYRSGGPGIVRVGDLVGLYYPRQGGTWLGCPHSQCAKATCPGYPSTAHGFATQEHWYRCWGEVFRIYAKGKSLGATINSDDDVAFYYLQDQLWVALGFDNMVKYPCLGTSRPPPLHNYDGCAFETFRVWKRI